MIEDENGSKEKQPRILLCHISNPHSMHEEDTIYPKNFHQIYYSSASLRQNGDRIHFHGLDRSDYFILSDTVVYIEAAHESRHSILHTVDGESVEVFTSVSALEKRYHHLFLRCHQSYLVNPGYIRNIRRFKLTLSDGTQLPIPEKKYTAFRDMAIQQFSSKSL